MATVAAMMVPVLPIKLLVEMKLSEIPSTNMVATSRLTMFLLLFT